MSRGRADAALGNLDRDSWKRVEALLDRAMELSGAARAGFLDGACAGDEALRRVLDTLLAADSTSGSLLDRPLPEQGLAALLDPGEAEPIPERIGPWRVLREIGRGGMGVVCLAERADGQFRQRAAIKLVKRGLDTDEILSRFRRERQILAQLEHPHIARLLDGGATADGRPYLVMEYVDGVPLTEHCRSRALALEETLALFDQACEAVQYAHRNLVVHRDLKPSHVMVSAGAVKLLDFGIAKVLAPEEDDPEAPETRAPRLTPDYAAPEQIRGEPATTATDVYALGVVLYELLAGSRPPRPGAGPEPAPEPEPASATAARNARAPRAPGRSSPAGAAPIGDWWRRRGRGDLDDIVAMAIRREPERRYPSVEALREDLARFRAGRPVRATRSTWRYRSAKWIARNRVAVTAGALVVLSLVAGLVGTAWQAHRASRERDRALVEVRKARELKDFALGLFEVSDPAQSRGASITARDLLERGTARVERELRDQPAVRAEMLDLIAGVYFQLGAYDRAESLETRALDLRRRAAGPRSAEVAASLNRLGQICTEKAQYARATTYLRQALALRVARAARNDAEVAETLSNLASALRRSGQLDSAEALFRRALADDEAAFGPHSAETAADLDNLGVIMIDRQRYPEAVSLQGRALEIRRRALGEDHPMTATTAENLALALQGAGRTREAIALHEEALRIRRRVLDPGHIDLAQTLGNYANLKRDLGDYAGAAAMYAEALEIERRTFGPDHPDVARDMNNLAILEYQLGRAEAARRHFEEAHAFLVRTKGPDYPGSLTMEQNVAIVLRGMGRYAEAERGLRRVLARRRAVEGPEHPDLAGAEHHLGILLHLEGRSAEGETLLRRALARREKALGDSAAGVGQTLEALAGVLRDRGRYAESLPLYRRAVAIDARVFPAISPQTAEAFVGLGRLLLLMGRPREAEPYLRDALALRARAYGGDNPKTAEAAVALGLCGRAAHEPGPSADSLIASGLPVLRRQPGRPDPLVALAGRAEPAVAR